MVPPEPAPRASPFQARRARRLRLARPNSAPAPRGPKARRCLRQPRLTDSVGSLTAAPPAGLLLTMVPLEPAPRASSSQLARPSSAPAPRGPKARCCLRRPRLTESVGTLTAAQPAGLLATMVPPEPAPRASPFQARRARRLRLARPSLAPATWVPKERCCSRRPRLTESVGSTIGAPPAGLLVTMVPEEPAPRTSPPPPPRRLQQGPNPVVRPARHPSPLS